MLQALLQLLLLLWGKMTKLGVVLQRPLLLIQGHIPVVAQPVAGVALLHVVARHRAPRHGAA